MYASSKTSVSSQSSCSECEAKGNVPPNRKYARLRIAARHNHHTGRYCRFLSSPTESCDAQLLYTAITDVASLSAKTAGWVGSSVLVAALFGAMTGNKLCPSADQTGMCNPNCCSLFGRSRAFARLIDPVKCGDRILMIKQEIPRGRPA